MVSIRAHYNGEVFVPEEPVDLPRDVSMRLVVVPVDEKQPPLMSLAKLADEFPEDPTWPADGASEHDHYLYGTPKHGK